MLVILLGELDELALAHIVAKPEPLLRHARADLDITATLAPRVSLTFNPANKDHLREIKECNNLPAGTIEKARWIKPEYRRAPGQKAAHAILAIRDVNAANMCIRDGISIFGIRIRPSRLKHEPMQCIKCRRWGHFANACMATTNTCGTCGATRGLMNAPIGKTYTVSRAKRTSIQAGIETVPNSTGDAISLTTTSLKIISRTFPQARTGC